MKIGDLVRKIDGYGKEMGWIGLIIGSYIQKRSGHKKVIVLTEGEIDHWIGIYVERIDETG